MRKFPVVYMRGGTSKGIMFLEKDLPGREEWDDIFVQCMGSPDPKQIDGVGGCVSSNNKIVVVRPSERPGVDVDYIVGGDADLLAVLKARISFAAPDGRSWVATNFLAGAEPSVEPGRHRATWDTKADGVTNAVADGVVATVELVQQPHP